MEFTTTTQVTNPASIDAGIIEEMEHMRDSKLETIQRFRDGVAKHNTSVSYLIEGAARVIEAEFIWGAIVGTLHLVRKGRVSSVGESLGITVTLDEAIKEKKEILEEQLLENRWAGGSTSQLVNGVDAAKADAARSAFRAFQCWNEGRSYLGHFGKKEG